MCLSFDPTIPLLGIFPKATLWHYENIYAEGYSSETWL